MTEHHAVIYILKLDLKDLILCKIKHAFQNLVYHELDFNLLY
jgi:hypothetical protein